MKPFCNLAASGTEDAPSSMVSSEAESEGSVLSEVPRHEIMENLSNNLDRTLNDSHVLQDKPISITSDWRTNSTVSSYTSTRG